MKNFFASLLGTFAALLLFVFGAIIIVFVSLGVMAAMSERAPDVQDGSYLVFDLSANIMDAPAQLDGTLLTQALLGSGESETLQLRIVTEALETAAADPRIAGLLIVGEMTPAGYGSGFAALREVRGAIEEFRASGKPVQAYLEQAGTREYYLASAADDLALDPYGLLAVPGLASEPVFFANALDKFGIGVQVTRVGRYKSAVEPFTRTDLSPENREQFTQLLGDTWSEILNTIAASRELEPAQVQAIVDAEGILQAGPAVDAGLITRAAYRDEIIAELRAKTGTAGASNTFRQINLANYARAAGVIRRDGGSGSGIAIVYAEGDIVDGEGGIGNVGGERFARAIRRLRQDEDVKAIVLRVNSPGGSASASEHIQRELRLAREVKPVVVSMGSYAASGGYWISAYADRIFAEPTTITGSIGVFGVLFNIQQLANETLGITFDTVKTGQFADAFTISRPKTPQELAMIQKLVDWIYDEFVGKVADARGLDRAVVEEIAQGRVWSGTEALRLGLVDELGGLEQAIADAAARAGLAGDVELMEYPRRKELAEVLAEMLSGANPSDGSGLASRVARSVQEELGTIESFNDPRGIYARMPLELKIR